YRQLEIISQDEQKRLEYTARQKAIYDYNTLIEENYNRGEATGIKKGIKQGIEQATSSIAEKMRAKGYSEQEIAELLS
ncbi:MAG: hypothetical protein NC247_12825, partial [Ruminococcus flavefaciens]|nr:hypothetical protein [Ruminococcus flavefaciens]